MKLCLASQGFMNDEIAESIAKLVEKPLKEINVAIINESYVGRPGHEDKRWLIKELAKLENYIGGRIDFVNLRAYDLSEIEQRLKNADLIYIVGGKQHFLSRILRETKTFDLLKNLANEKVIMGTSAGAMLLGRQIESPKFWQQKYSQSLIEAKSDPELALVNFNIIPHYARPDQAKWTKTFFTETLKDNPFPIFAITDNQAVIYDDGELIFVGGNPEVFGKSPK